MLDLIDGASAEVAWAAGLFEGEGCFASYEQAGVRASLGMTDEQPVREFHRIIGVGKIRIRPAKPRLKQQWIWTVSNWHDVARTFRLLEPYLSPRRRAKAVESLDAHGNGRIWGPSGSRRPPRAASKRKG